MISFPRVAGTCDGPQRFETAKKVLDNHAVAQYFVDFQIFCRFYELFYFCVWRLLYIQLIYVVIETEFVIISEMTE